MMIRELHPTTTPSDAPDREARWGLKLPEKCNGRSLATPYTPAENRRLSQLIAGHARGREMAWRIARVADPRDVADNELLFDLAARLARLANQEGEREC